MPATQFRLILQGTDNNIAILQAIKNPSVLEG
jgi:hypothetical protein